MLTNKTNKQEKQDLVSVIVPVYNVENYIDKCLGSLVAQTYNNIEIILIIGKSTDGSTERCHEWARKDKRIICIEERKKGLSAARNQGIETASGKYIVFVDSDDETATTFIEDLYTAISGDDADFAECDYYRIGEGGHKAYAACTHILDREFGLTDKIALGRWGAWKYITKRSLWIDNKIRFPETNGEDFAVYFLLLLLANKIANVRKPLYFYNRFRVNNLNHHIENLLRGIDAVHSLMTEMNSREMFEAHKELADVYVRLFLSRNLSPCFNLDIDKNEYLSVLDHSCKVYHKYFSGALPSKMIMGSFNLCRIVSKLSVIEEPYSRINFMSMISINESVPLDISITHKNPYREKMLLRDKNRMFWDLFEELKPEYFFFDLLEERHNILYFREGYLTESDAYEGAIIECSETPGRIDRNSSECENLWKKSCDSFMSRLTQCMDPARIFLIENYLCEEYGDGIVKTKFENQEYIRQINSILAGYYSYIEKNYPNIVVIKASKENRYFTDYKYEFGCDPWSLNEWVNIDIANRIVEKDRDQKLMTFFENRTKANKERA